MDRREFLKTTFAASAATVALGAAPKPKVDVAMLAGDTLYHVEADGRIYVEAPDGRREVGADVGTTDLNVIAQHLLTALATRLTAHGWATTLHEHQGEPLWNKGGGRDTAFGGYGLGVTVPAYKPGDEQFTGVQPVVLAQQIGAVWEVPSRLTGQRRELYRPWEAHDMRNIADLAAELVALAQLDPIVTLLTERILSTKTNVFSPGLYMPHMEGEPEGAVGIASRTYGLAIRVVRCVGVDRTLMMRADLLGGTFPSDPVNS